MMFAQHLTVKRYGRGRHDALEVDEDTPFLRLLGQCEVPTVDGYELVFLVVETVPRECAIGVR